MAALDFQTGNEYKYISNVGVQRRDAFVCIGIYICVNIYSVRMRCVQIRAVRFDFQKVMRATVQRDRETYIEKEAQTHKLDWTPVWGINAL